MKTYKIVKHFTCPYIGQRNGGDKTLKTGLTLREAHRELLDMFNEQMARQRLASHFRLFDTKFAPNWGIAVANTRKNVHQAYPTRSDGTRMFEYDSRQFDIIEE
jgi:hypothetical protein